MFEKLIENLILTYCGNFIENLEENKINVSLLSGKLKLENVKFKNSFFKDNKLPFKLISSLIKSLEITIPWTSNFTKPTSIVIDKVFLNLELIDNQFWEPLEFNSVTSKLAKINTFMISKLTELQASLASKEKEGFWDKYKSSLITSVVDNLHIEIKDVRIYISQNSKFSFGFEFNFCKIVNTNSNWEEAFIDRSNNKNVTNLFKLMQLDKLSLFLNTGADCNSKNYNIERNTTNQGEVIKEYLISPLTIFSKLTINEKNSLKPSIEANIELDHFDVELKKAQYDSIIKLTNTISQYQLFQHNNSESNKYLYFKPKYLIKDKEINPDFMNNYTNQNNSISVSDDTSDYRLARQNYKSLFKYSIRIILKKLNYIKGNKEEFLINPILINHYKKRFSEILIKQVKNDNITLNDIEDLEERRELYWIMKVINTDILMQWSIPIIEKKFKLMKEKENESVDKTEKKSFISSIFGSKKTNNSTNSNVSEKESAKINEFFNKIADSFETKLKEKHEEINNNTSSVSKDSAQLTINFVLKKGSFSLTQVRSAVTNTNSNSNNTKFAYIEGITLEYKELFFSLKKYDFSQVILIEANLRSFDFFLIDYINKDSIVIPIIGKKKEPNINNNTNSTNITNTDISNNNNINSNNLPSNYTWYITFKYFLDENSLIASELSIYLTSFDIIYRETLVSRLMSYFLIKPEFDESLVDNAVEKWSKIKIETKQKIQSLLKKENFFKLKVESRKLIMPFNKYNDKEGRFLVLVLGETIIEKLESKNTIKALDMNKTLSGYSSYVVCFNNIAIVLFENYNDVEEFDVSADDFTNNNRNSSNNGINNVTINTSNGKNDTITNYVSSFSNYSSKNNIIKHNNMISSYFKILEKTSADMYISYLENKEEEESVRKGDTSITNNNSNSNFNGNKPSIILNFNLKQAQLYLTNTTIPTIMELTQAITPTKTKELFTYQVNNNQEIKRRAKLLGVTLTKKTSDKEEAKSMFSVLLGGYIYFYESASNDNYSSSFHVGNCKLIYNNTSKTVYFVRESEFNAYVYSNYSSYSEIEMTNNIIEDSNINPDFVAINKYYNKHTINATGNDFLIKLLSNINDGISLTFTNEIKYNNYLETLKLRVEEIMLLTMELNNDIYENKNESIEKEIELDDDEESVKIREFLNKNDKEGKNLIIKNNNKSLNNKDSNSNNDEFICLLNIKLESVNLILAKEIENNKNNNNIPLSTDKDTNNAAILSNYTNIDNNNTLSTPIITQTNATTKLNSNISKTNLLKKYRLFNNEINLGTSTLTYSMYQQHQKIECDLGNLQLFDLTNYPYTITSLYEYNYNNKQKIIGFEKESSMKMKVEMFDKDSELCINNISSIIDIKFNSVRLNYYHEQFMRFLDFILNLSGDGNTNDNNKNKERANKKIYSLSNNNTNNNANSTKSKILSSTTGISNNNNNYSPTKTDKNKDNYENKDNKDNFSLSDNKQNLQEYIQELTEKVFKKDKLKLTIECDNPCIYLKARQSFSSYLKLDLGKIYVSNKYKETQGRVRIDSSISRLITEYSVILNDLNVENENGFHLISKTNLELSIEMLDSIKEENTISDKILDRKSIIMIKTSEVNCNLRQEDLCLLLKINDLNLNYTDGKERFFKLDAEVVGGNSNNIVVENKDYTKTDDLISVVNLGNTDHGFRKISEEFSSHHYYESMVVKIDVNKIQLNLLVSESSNSFNNSTSSSIKNIIFSTLNINKLYFDLSKKLNKMNEIKIVIDYITMFYYENTFSTRNDDRNETSKSNINNTIENTPPPTIVTILSTKDYINTSKIDKDKEINTDNKKDNMINNHKQLKPQIELNIVIQPNSEKDMSLLISNTNLNLRVEVLNLIQNFFINSFPNYTLHEERDLPNSYDPNTDNSPSLKFYLEMINPTVTLQTSFQDIISLTSDVKFIYKRFQLSAEKDNLNSSYKELSKELGLIDNEISELEKNMSSCVNCKINIESFINNVSLNVSNKRNIPKFICNNCKKVFINNSTSNSNKVSFKDMCSSCKEWILFSNLCTQCEDINSKLLSLNSKRDKIKIKVKEDVSVVSSMNLWLYNVCPYISQNKNFYFNNNTDSKDNKDNKNINGNDNKNVFNNRKLVIGLDVYLELTNYIQFIKDNSYMTYSNTNIDISSCLIKFSYKDIVLIMKSIEQSSEAFEYKDYKRYLALVENKEAVNNTTLNKKIEKENVDKGNISLKVNLTKSKLVLVDNMGMVYYPFLSFLVSDFSYIRENYTNNNYYAMASFFVELSTFNNIAGIWEPFIERVKIEVNETQDIITNLNSSKIGDTSISNKNNISNNNTSNSNNLLITTLPPEIEQSKISKYDINIPEVFILPNSRLKQEERTVQNILNINFTDQVIPVLSTTLLEWITKFNKLKSNYSLALKEIQIINDEKQVTSNHKIVNLSGNDIYLFRIKRNNYNKPISVISVLENGAEYDLEHLYIEENYSLDFNNKINFKDQQDIQIVFKMAFDCIYENDLKLGCVNYDQIIRGSNQTIKNLISGYNNYNNNDIRNHIFDDNNSYTNNNNSNTYTNDIRGYVLEGNVEYDKNKNEFRLKNNNYLNNNNNSNNSNFSIVTKNETTNITYNSNSQTNTDFHIVNVDKLLCKRHEIDYSYVINSLKSALEIDSLKYLISSVEYSDMKKNCVILSPLIIKNKLEKDLIVVLNRKNIQSKIVKLSYNNYLNNYNYSKDKYTKDDCLNSNCLITDEVLNNPNFSESSQTKLGVGFQYFDGTIAFDVLSDTNTNTATVTNTLTKNTKKNNTNNNTNTNTDPNTKQIYNHLMQNNFNYTSFTKTQPKEFQTRHLLNKQNEIIEEYINNRYYTFHISEENLDQKAQIHNNTKNNNTQMKFTSLSKIKKVEIASPYLVTNLLPFDLTIKLKSKNKNEEIVIQKNTSSYISSVSINENLEAKMIIEKDFESNGFILLFNTKDLLDEDNHYIKDTSSLILDPKFIKNISLMNYETKEFFHISSKVGSIDPGRRVIVIYAKYLLTDFTNINNLSYNCKLKSHEVKNGNEKSTVIRKKKNSDFKGDLEYYRNYDLQYSRNYDNLSNSKNVYLLPICSYFFLSCSINQCNNNFVSSNTGNSSNNNRFNFFSGNSSSDDEDVVSDKFDMNNLGTSTEIVLKDKNNIGFEIIARIDMTVISTKYNINCFVISLYPKYVIINNISEYSLVINFIDGSDGNRNSNVMRNTNNTSSEYFSYNTKDDMVLSSEEIVPFYFKNKYTYSNDVRVTIVKDNSKIINADTKDKTTTSISNYSFSPYIPLINEHYNTIRINELNTTEYKYINIEKRVDPETNIILLVFTFSDNNTSKLFIDNTLNSIRIKSWQMDTISNTKNNNNNNLLTNITRVNPYKKSIFTWENLNIHNIMIIDFDSVDIINFKNSSQIMFLRNMMVYIDFNLLEKTINSSKENTSRKASSNKLDLVSMINNSVKGDSSNEIKPLIVTLSNNIVVKIEIIVDHMRRIIKLTEINVNNNSLINTYKNNTNNTNNNNISNSIEELNSTTIINTLNQFSLDIKISSLGVSLITDNRMILKQGNNKVNYERVEIFYLLANDILCTYDCTEIKETDKGIKIDDKNSSNNFFNKIEYSFRINTFEIDNEYAILTYFPIIADPVNNTIIKTEEDNTNNTYSTNDNNSNSKPFLNVLIQRVEYPNSPSRNKYSLINYLIQPVNINIESQFLEQIIFFVNNMNYDIINTSSAYKNSNTANNTNKETISILYSNTNSNINSNKQFFDNESFENQIQFFLNNDNIRNTLVPLFLQKDFLSKSVSETFIEKLEASPLEIYLSVKTQNITKILKQYVTTNPIINMIISNILNIDKTLVSIEGYQINNLFGSSKVIMNEILNTYHKSAYNQYFKLLFSTEILGSPISLYNNISNGIACLIKKPAEGLVRGPVGFLEGSIEGSRNLMAYTVSGTFSSASKISSGVSRTLLNLTRDEKYISNIEKNKLRSKPNNFIEGLGNGIAAAFGGVYGGVTDVVLKPVEGVKQHGVKGLFGGMFKGVTGLLAKPISGIFELISQSSEGLTQTFNVEKVNVVKVRKPRPFYTKEQCIKEFNKYHAEVYSLIKRNQNNLNIHLSNIQFCDCVDYLNMKKEPNLIVFGQEEFLLLGLPELKFKADVYYSNISSIEIKKYSIRFNYKTPVSNKEHESIYLFYEKNPKEKEKESVENLNKLHALKTQQIGSILQEVLSHNYDENYDFYIKRLGGYNK